VQEFQGRASSKGHLSAHKAWLLRTLRFTMWILRSNLRNYRGLAITLGVPLFMLVSLWLPSLGEGEEGAELMEVMFPAIVVLGVVMAGLPHATRLVRWREAGILKRLALTPVPLAGLMLGAGATQVSMGVLQGGAMLIFGLLAVGIAISLQGGLLTLGVMVLAATTFVCLGSLVASLAGKPEAAGYGYFFIIMPLVFLASFPSDMLPTSINSLTPWLPTTMAVELLGSLLSRGVLPDRAILPGSGLLAYAMLFTAISSKLFRWDA
jgi:ABC-2 type transport system permease protein